MEKKYNLVLELEGINNSELSSVVNSFKTAAKCIKNLNITTCEDTIIDPFIRYKLPADMNQDPKDCDLNLDIVKSDSVKKYIYSNLRFNIEDETFVTAHEMYSNYERFCKDNNLRCISPGNFAQIIVKFIYKDHKIPDANYPTDYIFFGNITLYNYKRYDYLKETMRKDSKEEKKKEPKKEEKKKESKKEENVVFTLRKHAIDKVYEISDDTANSRTVHDFIKACVSFKAVKDVQVTGKDIYNRYRRFMKENMSNYTYADIETEKSFIKKVVIIICKEMYSRCKGVPSSKIIFEGISIR